MNLWLGRRAAKPFRKVFRTGRHWVSYALEAGRREFISDFAAWVKTAAKGSAELITLERPWITFPAARWLESYLRGRMTAFEWGAGGSTLFLARRVRHVVTVEHDSAWAERVLFHLATRKVANVQLLHIPGQHSTPVRRSDAELFTSKTCPNLWFEHYVKAICAYPDEYFDVICVDGRARPGCLFYARRKLKMGGAIVFDNSERERYQDAFRFFDVAHWDVMHFPGPGPAVLWPAFWRTTILIAKPVSNMQSVEAYAGT